MLSTKSEAIIIQTKLTFNAANVVDGLWLARLSSKVGIWLAVRGVRVEIVWFFLFKLLLPLKVVKLTENGYHVE